MPIPWSDIEVELIVSDYFSMLISELQGEDYSKAQHRRNLLPLLSNRSEGSIEFKHQNISAILIKLGQPYIRGYLPRYNFQKVLEEKVIAFLASQNNIENYFSDYIDQEVVEHKVTNFSNLIVEPPKLEKSILLESSPLYHKNPIKVNYLEREQFNRNLGRYGEQIVLEYEKWNLVRLGKEKLAEKVEWISNDLGDGAGFDILSKNVNGTDKFIEVKTTRLGKETPFFFSKNELDFSVDKSKNYHLFRLFNAENNVKMFTKKGALNEVCSSVPIMYKGYF